MDAPKLIKTLSRRQRSAVWNASENREYRPAELLQLPLFCPSASLPICRPRTPPLVSYHIPRGHAREIMDHAELNLTETIPEMEPRPCDIVTTNVSGSGSIPESHSSASITHRSIFSMKFCRRNSTDSAGNSRLTRASEL